MPNTGDHPVFMLLFYKVYRIDLCKKLLYHFFLLTWYEILVLAHWLCVRVFSLERKRKVFKYKKIYTILLLIWNYEHCVSQRVSRTRNKITTFFCSVIFTETYVCYVGHFLTLVNSMWIWHCVLNIGFEKVSYQSEAQTRTRILKRNLRMSSFLLINKTNDNTIFNIGLRPISLRLSALSKKRQSGY